MPPRTAGPSSASSIIGGSRTTTTSSNADDRRWVTVSWMPHASLSQTSNVAISIKSILAIIDVTATLPSARMVGNSNAVGGGCTNKDHNDDDEDNNIISPGSSYDDGLGVRRRGIAGINSSRQDWKVVCTIHGVAGLDLVPVSVMTPSAPLVPIKEDQLLKQQNDSKNDLGRLGSSSSRKSWRPLVADATHICQFEKDIRTASSDDTGVRGNDRQPCILHMPLRWRELPRDAYLKFQVTGPADNLLYEATLPFFDAFGKLHTGMKRIDLYDPSDPYYRSEKYTQSNPGLTSPPRRTERKSSWQQDDNDPEWKASRILDQLDRFDEATRNSNILAATSSTGVGGRNAGVSTSTGGSQPNAVATGLSTITRLGYGEIPSVPWLDKIARECCLQTLNEGEEKSDRVIVGRLGSSRRSLRALPVAFLIIEFPTFEIPILYEETPYPNPQQGPSGSVAPLDLALHYHEKAKKAAATEKSKSATAGARDTISVGIDPPPFHPLDMIPFLDYEDENDSPIDDKYRTLAHDLLRGLVDPALKPDRTQRDKLASIIASPSHHPTREEKDLLWRFRFSLVDNRRALTKFLLAVDWTVESEVVQAAELLEQWRKRSPIEVTDALKLLGKQVAYQTNLVRAYAIDTLASAPDEELVLYLLQLVQALKFENVQEAGGLGTAGIAGSFLTSQKKSSLATFLIGRAARNVELATYLYWYLKVEIQDPAHGARYQEIFAELQHALSQTLFPSNLIPASRINVSGMTESSSSQASTEGSTATKASMSDSSKLADSIANIKPFNKLVESVSKFGDKLMGAEPHTTDSSEIVEQNSKSKKGRSVWDVLTDQDSFISGIMDVQLSYASKGKQIAKQSHLRTVLAKDGYDRNPNGLPFPLPCAPQIMVNGIQPQNAKVFKSAVYPALIEFNVEYVIDKNDFVQFQPGSGTSRSRHRGGGRSSAINSSHGTRVDLQSYRVMMKTGDDLRQDQLAMMMIKLMDGLLKRASLDLCITTYSIIATSHSSGMIEFVEESSPISQILANHNNSILQFLQSCAPQTGAKHGVRPDIMSTYVRSVAGESVITYLLGVGDRHLDNLMMTRTGNLFHIDFGFLFGRDPKPFPPAFRLTREMVDGMGGMESSEYRQFCSLACQAFNALRKSAGLILNLLHLMSDAGIEDLSNNPSADAEGVIAKVEERFRLDLTDEQAERFFLNLINDTLAAWAPKVSDWVHAMAVARR